MIIKITFLILFGLIYNAESACIRRNTYELPMGNPPDTDLTEAEWRIILDILEQLENIPENNLAHLTRPNSLAIQHQKTSENEEGYKISAADNSKNNGIQKNNNGGSKFSKNHKNIKNRAILESIPEDNFQIDSNVSEVRFLAPVSDENQKNQMENTTETKFNPDLDQINIKIKPEQFSESTKKEISENSANSSEVDDINKTAQNINMLKDVTTNNSTYYSSEGENMNSEKAQETISDTAVISTKTVEEQEDKAKLIDNISTETAGISKYPESAVMKPTEDLLILKEQPEILKEILADLENIYSRENETTKQQVDLKVISENNSNNISGLSQGNKILKEIEESSKLEDKIIHSELLQNSSLIDDTLKQQTDAKSESLENVVVLQTTENPTDLMDMIIKAEEIEKQINVGGNSQAENFAKQQEVQYLQTTEKSTLAEQEVRTEPQEQSENISKMVENNSSTIRGETLETTMDQEANKDSNNTSENKEINSNVNPIISDENIKHPAEVLQQLNGNSSEQLNKEFESQNTETKIKNSDIVITNPQEELKTQNQEEEGLNNSNYQVENKMIKQDDKHNTEEEGNPTSKDLNSQAISEAINENVANQNENKNSSSGPLDMIIIKQNKNEEQEANKEEEINNENSKDVNGSHRENFELNEHNKEEDNKEIRENLGNNKTENNNKIIKETNETPNKTEAHRLPTHIMKIPRKS